ncbi:FAD-binding oxidoreductase [Arthrobacter sp. I2-34]|uniref:FAD-binding oxidoreductase n=1 Tax=Arthrobacter hankyongi TaxID=2904801 RepID=A0ABS9LAY4_9MICC|nr:FAD-binding oxidoreductase [Arthrobacter hankyongi]MCG2623743.1 FAD-binding oxidoreductase [Arthrobacter hankyongi]
MSSAWHIVDVVAVQEETATARTIGLRFPLPVRSLPGQHLDLRLTAPDGYQAVRSYSVASASPPDTLEITVEELPDGEVSPYLVRKLAVGDQLEVRGPVGGWFVWRPEDASPVQLIAGGSGVVPLMAMVRAHDQARHPAPFRLLYSVRDPESVYYRQELESLAGSSSGLAVDYVYTRRAPAGRPVGRLDARILASSVFGPEADPAVFICGATGFVETVSGWLVDSGYPPERIKTERYGGMGGTG